MSAPYCRRCAVLNDSLSRRISGGLARSRNTSGGLSGPAGRFAAIMDDPSGDRRDLMSADDRTYIRAVKDPDERPQSGEEQPELSIDAMYEALLRDVEGQKNPGPPAAAAAANRSVPVPPQRPAPGPGVAGASPDQGTSSGPQQRPKNAWGRNILILVVIIAAAYGYVHYRHPFAAKPAASPTHPAGSASPTGTHVPAITVAHAFPSTVPGQNGETYKLVGGVKLTSCSEPDMVEPYLAGLLAQSGGCAGAVAALYGDGAKNEFTIVVFTLDNPADAMSITATLTTDPADYQIGAIVPPDSSGLAALPAPSGLVQAFSGASHALVIGVAQWSDGRSSDFNTLESLLQPLQQAVTTRAGTAGG
jgi:hypothetical protein